jgi:hypothetical protein
MAETGIMGSSGDFRTNQTSTSNPAGNTAKSGFGKAADIFARSSEQRRKISNEQFQAAARIHGIKTEGKQVRKTMKTTAKLQSNQMAEAKRLGYKTFGGNYQTGEHTATAKEPRTRAASSAAPTAAPAKPAATRTSPVYNARNPHPKNPFGAGTKEHKSYNSATGPQRAAMTRRSKQGPK